MITNLYNPILKVFFGNELEKRVDSPYFRSFAIDPGIHIKHL